MRLSPTPCRVCFRPCVFNKFSHFWQKISRGSAPHPAAERKADSTCASLVLAGPARGRSHRTMDCVPGLPCLSRSARVAETSSARVLLDCAGWTAKLSYAAGAVNATAGGHNAIAVCMTGLPALALRQVHLGHADLFIHTEASLRSVPTVLALVTRLQPVAWRAVGWQFQRVRGACAWAGAACHSEDSDDPTKEFRVGCYDRSKCIRCQADKYLAPLLRRWLAWQLAVQHEAQQRTARYELVAYVRLDGLEQPHCWNCRTDMLQTLQVGNTSVRVSQFRHFGQLITSDNGAIMGRAAADRYFSAALEIGRCQSREYNERICGVGSWGLWASPECLLKVHLLRNHTNCEMMPSLPVEIGSPLSTAQRGVA